jgi:hypothetical protein
MTSRSFALLAGIVSLGAGVLGFLPGITQPPPADAPPLAVSAGYGYFLGLFPINVLHNFVHLGLGAWGLLAYNSFSAARSYARGLAIMYSVLTVMGVLPVLNTTFGLLPLFGHDIWLHALTAIVAAYCGWGAPAELAVPRVRTRNGKVKVWEDRPDFRPHA